MTGSRFSRLSGRCKTLFIANKWGGQSLISLYISILSGIVLALQYDDAAPFYSTATIELIVPYGSFWRALHYYSSQLFFLLLIGHVIAVIWKGEKLMPRTAWVRVCTSLVAAVLLLFTGYVLRGDATGEAAGAIAENICLSIPLIGDWVNDLFFDIGDSGLRKVYMHHLIGLVVLGGWALWQHLRRYPALWRNHVVLTVVILTTAVLLTTPSEPERMGLLHIAGPWFFLGLQELLRFMPVFLAGVAIPLLPVLLLFGLPEQPEKRTWFLWGIGLWLVAYAVISLISYWRIFLS